jgi:hypothetical protein
VFSIISWKCSSFLHFVKRANVGYRFLPFVWLLPRWRSIKCRSKSGQTGYKSHQGGVEAIHPHRPYSVREQSIVLLEVTCREHIYTASYNNCIVVNIMIKTSPPAPSGFLIELPCDIVWRHLCLYLSLIHTHCTILTIQENTVLHKLTIKDFL